MSEKELESAQGSWQGGGVHGEQRAPQPSPVLLLICSLATLRPMGW